MKSIVENTYIFQPGEVTFTGIAEILLMYLQIKRLRGTDGGGSGGKKTGTATYNGVTYSGLHIVELD